jgi:hypothetical protein
MAISFTTVQAVFPARGEGSEDKKATNAQNPLLAPSDDSVERTRAVGVNVKRRPRASRSDDEPAMVGALLLCFSVCPTAEQAQKVVRKVIRECVPVCGMRSKTIDRTLLKCVVRPTTSRELQ